MPSIATRLEALEQLLPALPQQYHRLILIVGRHGVGKAHLLKEFSRQEAPAARVRRLLAEILNEQPEETLVKRQT